MLAKKVKGIFNTDIGISIVGFAGPKAKRGVNIGTVFIAVSYKNLSLSKKIVINGGRDAVRKKASYEAINLIPRIIKDFCKAK